MSENLHNIDDLFKRALGDDEEEPSAGVWENLDRKLDKRSVVHINQKYRRVKWVAAASLIMVAALGMYTLYTRKINNELVKEKKEKILKEAKTSNISPIGTDTASFASGENRKDNIPATEVSITKGSSIAPTEKQQVEAAAQINKKIKTPVLEERSASKTQAADDAIASENRIIKKKFGQSNSAGKRNIAKNLKQDLEKGSDVYNETASANKNESKLRTQVVSPTVSSDINSPVNSSINKEELSNLLAIIPRGNYMVQETTTGKSMLDKNIRPINNYPEINNNANKIPKTALAKNRTGFSATISYSPDVVRAKVQKDRPRFREDDRNEIKKDEDTKVSSTIGLLVNYTFNNNWTVSSGLSYFTRATDIRSKTIYARPDSRGNVKYRFNCSVGSSYVSFKTGATSLNSGDSVRTVSSKSSLDYIGIPLAVRYNLSFGRFSLSPGFGISANILTKGEIETSIATSNGHEKARVTDIEGLKQSYFSGAISLYTSYEISKTLAITVAPTNRFAITSINKNAPVKTYLNSTGFAAGLNIKF